MLNEVQLNANQPPLIAEQVALQYRLDAFNEHIPFPAPKSHTFTFIDLFAGIGGFRLVMQNLGGRCVFSSEWDEQSQKTYEANFGEVPFGDITNKQSILCYALCMIFVLPILILTRAKLKLAS